MKSTTGRNRASRFLDSLVLLGIAAVLAWFAGTSLVRQTHYVDLHRTARALERGQKLTAAAVERRSADIERLIAASDCDDADIGSGITLSLAAIEYRNPALDFDAWSTAVEKSRELLRVALACSPYRGAFWARLAVVERLIAAAPGRIMPLAAMSVRLAPAELGVVRTRFQLWRGAAAWLPADAAAPLESDLRIVLADAMLPDIKQMVGNSASLKELIRREAPRTSEERQVELARLRFDEQAKTNDAATGEPKRPQFDLLDKPRR